MSRNSKFIALVVAMALVASAGLAAQAASTNADAKLFCIDIGMVSGYSLLSNDAIAGRNFGFNITVADNFALGVASIATTNRTYTALRAAYYLTPAIGFDLYVGSSSAGAGVGTGACAFYNILKSKSDTSFANSLKVKLGYLFNTDDGIDMGDIFVAVSTSLGY